MGVLMAWISSLFSVEPGNRTVDLIRPHSCVGSSLEREAPLEIMKHGTVCCHKHMQLGLSPEDLTL
jgi:hypothetical protein